MSTGYSWEGISQVRVTLLGTRHVPERLCGFLLGVITSARPLPLRFVYTTSSGIETLLLKPVFKISSKQKFNPNHEVTFKQQQQRFSSILNFV